MTYIARVKELFKIEKQKFLKGTPPILQVIYAIEQYCDRTDKTDEYKDWLVSVVNELERKGDLLDKIGNRWVEIETNGTTEEADNFYTFVQDILSPEPE